MYVAEQFAMASDEALRQADARGVGDLITHGDRGLDVTMLPFVLLGADDEPRRLTTHMARTNLQWHDEGPALMVVHGPDAYISPEVMPVHDEPSRLPTVPTWNYLVVHLVGRLITHHDDDWKLQSLYDLTARHEPAWRLENGPVSAIERMLPAIVGIEFVIDDVIGKAKLSQNKSSDDLKAMASQLADSGHSPQTADVMRRLALPYIAAREERVAQARELNLRRRQAGR
ncbi:FMN-binding negative transcriptional regulator, partial [Brooklawnia sp.]|uniref:FMN-binding negative transcriptional regulator n=1 Tax=Brooklawnia sp. TaxID=2699740 RepID=UPI00311E4607